MKRERLLLIVLAVLAFVISGCLGPTVGQISGVVAYVDGTAIEGAVVSVAGRSTETDAEGAFQFNNIRVGTYTLTVKLDGFILREEKVTVSAQPVRLEIELERPPATVSGQVLFQDGRPVENATVTLAGLSAQTEADGSFTFDEVFYGTYTVVVSLDDGLPVHSQEIDVDDEEVDAVLNLPINGPNILVNPNLLGSADQVPPEGWSFWGDPKNGHKVTLIDEDDPERRAWLLEDVIGGERGNHAEIGLTQSVPGGPGRYRAVFRMGLAEDGRPNQAVFLQLRFNPSKDNKGLRVVPEETVGFEEFVIEHEAPADTTEVVVYLFTQAEERATVRVRSIAVYPIL